MTEIAISLKVTVVRLGTSRSINDELHNAHKTLTAAQ
jgi:hypothetical protein